MHVAQIITADCANGPGIRLSLFVSGCTNQCEGCFQPQAWDFAFGKPFDNEMENYILYELGKSYYSGITILGGEPFEPSNQEALLPLIRRIRSELPDKSIWMYTGNLYDRDLVPGGLKYTPYTDAILNFIDVLVDGPFVASKRRLDLNYRGSENQRIIDMAATRQSGQIVLSELNN